MSIDLSAQLNRFDVLIDAPNPHAPLRGLCLRRAGGAVRLAATVARAWLTRPRAWSRSRHHRRDAGMTTAEYAVGTVAACGFAALLYKVVTSGAVSSALNALVNRALHAV